VETTTMLDIPLLTIAGEPTTLADFAGKVLLVVNVASRCGLTPQYEGLERLHEKYRDQGLEVLGFPANDFGAQEPGSNEEIAEFCTTQYSVTFPMLAKVVVTGPDKHPLYDALVGAVPRAQGDPDGYREKLRGYGLTPTEEPEVLWNFEKFLVDRTGQVVGRFAPTMKPEDPAIVAAVERELAR
jgi:glutathione peroxidase